MEKKLKIIDFIICVISLDVGTSWRACYCIIHAAAARCPWCSVIFDCLKVVVVEEEQEEEEEEGGCRDNDDRADTLLPSFRCISNRTADHLHALAPQMLSTSACCPSTKNSHVISGNTSLHPFSCPAPLYD